MNPAASSWSRSAERHVVIAGGGVIGICCAYYLARRGARVTVLERDEIGKGASYGNAGCIAPGHPPIDKPGRVKQALRSLFDPLSPLYLVPRPDLELAHWLWRFRQTCTESHLHAAMNTIGPLGYASRGLFDELMDRERLECAYRLGGYYEIYRTSQGLESAGREARMVSGYGFHTEVLSGEALREREPAIRPEIVGGVFHPEATTVNPYRFVSALAERAKCRGAEIRTSTEAVDVILRDGNVSGVRTRIGETIEADAFVVATGAYSMPLLQRLGFRLPLQAAKGYHRDFEAREGRPPLLRSACVLGENMVFCTPMDGFVRFAGTLEFSGGNLEIRRPRLEQLTNAAGRYFDGMEGATFRSEWCGLRPCLPDGLPAVGPVACCEGPFLATGHAMQGLTLGPVTGKLIAETILDGAPSLNIAALNPGRF